MRSNLHIRQRKKLTVTLKVLKVPSFLFHTDTHMPPQIIKSLSLSPPPSPGEEPRHWNLIKASISRAQMKLSHQSRSWDRMTQINKTESFGRSLCTLETPEPTWAGIRPVRRHSDWRWGEKRQQSVTEGNPMVPLCLCISFYVCLTKSWFD